MKRFLAYYPLIFIIIVWGIFTAPFFINNTSPFPAKFQNVFFAPWNAYPELGGPAKNQSMPDIIGQIYPWRSFTIEVWKSGAIPLWNPYSFSGTPHLANYQSAVLSPLNLGFLVFPFVDFWTILIVLQPLFAGIFTFLYLRALKLSNLPGLISSISFMFCGFIVSWMNYGTLAYAILFLPLALYAIEKYFQKLKFRFAILLSATIPLSFFSGHFQISIYFFLFIFAYLLFKFIQTKKKSITSTLLISVLFGLLLSSPQLFPSVELYLQSFRSTIFAKTEVIPWGYLPTLIAPDFFGNPVTGNDWFGHYAEWNAYIGVIGLFFSVYSIFSKRKDLVFFFITVGLISILLAFQSPLLDLLVYLKVPVISTSATGRIIVLFSFSASILAGLGMEKLYLDVINKKYKEIIILILLFMLIFVALWGIVFLKLYIPIEKIPIASSNLRLPSAIFFIFIMTVLGSFFLKKRNARFLLFLFLVIISSLELLRFAFKWQPYDSKKRVFIDTNVSKFFPKIAGFNRVFGNLGAEGTMYYHLQSTEGYDAVYIRKYGQFVASLDNGKLKDSFRSVVAYPKNGKYTLKGANLLGIKYIIHKTSDGQQVWAFPFWRYNPESIKLLFNDGHYQVLENKNAFPRVFAVNSVITEKDPQKILDKMFDSKTDLKKTAVIEEDLNTQIGSGSAKIIDYKANKVILLTKSKKSTFIVLTDVYYPGWKAYVNGKETKIFRTDFTFRGVVVPAGDNTVEFTYKPITFSLGVLTAIIGMVGIFTLYLFNNLRNKTV